MVEQGVSPASDGDSAFKGVGGLHEAFEDESANVNCFFSTGL